MPENALIKDCLDWFRDGPGLDPPPDMDRLHEIGPDPEAAIPVEDAPSVPVSRERLRWALAVSLGAGSVAVLAVHLSVGWDSPLAFLLLTAVFVLCYGFPAALAVSRERLAMDAGAEPAPELARAVALALYNANPARRFLHLALDMLLLPLLLSCQEAVAHWAARRYCLDRGYKPPRPSLRARFSSWPLALLARLGGQRAAGFVIRAL